MTCSFQTKDDTGFLFVSKSPHFFKIILNDQDDKLAIPRKFVKKYGNELPSMAVLDVPTGAEWKVELSQCDDGGIWFQKGWKEFADFYSLRKGHFLVFRYENKNGRFHVLVFDMTAAEIDYPLTKVRDEDLESVGKFQQLNAEEQPDVPLEIQEPCKEKSRGRPRKMLKTDTVDGGHNKGDTDEDDVSVEILEDIPPCNNTNKSRSKSPTISSRPRKRKMFNSNTMDEGQREITKQGSTEAFKPSKRIPTVDTCNRWECPQQAEILSSKYLATKDMDRALEIANEHKSQNPFFVVIVQQFHLRHNSRLGIPSNFVRKHLKLTLGTEATLCLSEGVRTWSAEYNHTAKNGRTRAQFLDGWREFAADNSLKAGDVCVFELIKDTMMISFKVAIHRLKLAANGLHPSQDKNSRGSVDYKGSKSDLLSSEKACISIGDDLEAGRFRFSDGNKDQNLAPTVDSVERRINNELMHNKGVAAAGADEASTPKNPYFERVLRSSHLSKGNLYIPFDFIEKHLEPNVKQVILQIANADGEWVVNLKRYPKCYQGLLTVGFEKFAEENSLKARDLCVFELMVPRKALFKVSILKQPQPQSQSNVISLDEY